MIYWLPILLFTLLLIAIRWGYLKSNSEKYWKNKYYKKDQELKRLVKNIFRKK